MRQHPAGLFERRLVNDHQRIYRKVHSLRFLGIVAELHGELRYVLPSGEHDIVFYAPPAQHAQRRTRPDKAVVRQQGMTVGQILVSVERIDKIIVGYIDLAGTLFQRHPQGQRRRIGQAPDGDKRVTEHLAAAHGIRHAVDKVENAHPFGYGRLFGLEFRYRRLHDVRQPETLPLRGIRYRLPEVLGRVAVLAYQGTIDVYAVEPQIHIIPFHIGIQDIHVLEDIGERLLRYLFVSPAGSEQCSDAREHRT